MKSTGNLQLSTPLVGFHVLNGLLLALTTLVFVTSRKSKALALLLPTSATPVFAWGKIH